MIYLITINYNNSGDTIECLKSLQAVRSTFNIIVIDNCSGKDDADALRRFVEEEQHGKSVSDQAGNSIFDDQIRLLLVMESRNLGFSGGNNHGIQLALEQDDFEGVVLLNNDTIVHPEFLNEIIRFRQGNKAADIIGGRIFLYQSKDILWYDGGNYNKRIGKPVHINENRNISEVLAKDTPHETEFITGCLMFISKKCLETTGLLNEALFMYSEDLDYCIRAREKGLKLYQVPTSVIWHKFSASSGGELSEFSAYWIIRNRFLVARWHASRFDQFSTFAYFLISRIPRFIKWGIQGHKGVIKAQLRGMIDGLRSHSHPNE
ncbi:MAG: glycosyltransferase family 2 protein [Bacteroidota bacterium]|nr:glycosyltransferase family 2 protein [Bacteroidota bacterium]